jgi:16S rRNA (cytosine967-C5)-methyltransferase
VSNAIPHLKPGGSFIYITCSVFRKENEEVVTFIKENFQLKLKNMEILKGYDKKADSMFVAVLGEEL